jgi:uncharacterized protein
MPATGGDQGTPEIRDHAALERFETDVGDDVAFLTYRREGDRLYLLHTEVPVPFRGRGTATRLVRGVLDRARAEAAVVVPICPFVKAFLKQHPEYQSLTRERGSPPSAH